MKKKKAKINVTSQLKGKKITTNYGSWSAIKDHLFLKNAE